MVGRQLVVAVGDQQQRPGPLHPPAQEHQQVQGRLVRPVGVLHHHHHHRGPASLVQLVQERGEHGLPRVPGGEQPGQPAAGLAGDVVQRPQRPGREQRVTGPQQEPGIRRVPLGEPPYQRRLADAGLARHQHDAAAGRRRGQHAGQLAQHRGALQQVHRPPTLPRAAPAFQQRASPPMHTASATPPTTARVCSGTMASGGKLPPSTIVRSPSTLGGMERPKEPAVIPLVIPPAVTCLVRTALHRRAG
jgi:hypothetical protein